MTVCKDRDLIQRRRVSIPLAGWPEKGSVEASSEKLYFPNGWF